MDESQEGDQRAAPGRDAEPAGPHAAVGGLAAVLWGAGSLARSTASLEICAHFPRQVSTGRTTCRQRPTRSCSRWRREWDWSCGCLKARRSHCRPWRGAQREVCVRAPALPSLHGPFPYGTCAAHLWTFGCRSYAGDMAAAGTPWEQPRCSASGCFLLQILRLFSQVAPKSPAPAGPLRSTRSCPPQPTAPGHR